MKSRQVMIVDDSIESVLVLSSLLKLEELEVTFALSGEEGLELARLNTPDVILLDIEMQGMNGIEACHQLKRDTQLSDIPIIFVSGHESEAVQLEALAAGAADFISKPFNPAITRARIKNQLAMKEMTDRLKSLATIDPLTGLANRRAFDERLAQEWHSAMRRHSSVCMVMLDVDHFKQYNDHYGHLKGDDCLQAIADALSSLARRATDVVARYGGEEFCVMLTESTPEQATAWAARMLDCIRALRIPHVACDLQVISVSVGVACMVPGVGDADPTQVTHLADQALYQSKQDGRNRMTRSG